MNLCVATAFNIQVAGNMMAYVHIVAGFFNNSPKSFDLLSQKIKEIPSGGHSPLINVCGKRWHPYKIPYKC